MRVRFLPPVLNEKRAWTFQFTPFSLVLRVMKKEESVCIAGHRTQVAINNSIIRLIDTHLSHPRAMVVDTARNPGGTREGVLRDVKLPCFLIGFVDSKEGG